MNPSSVNFLLKVDSVKHGSKDTISIRILTNVKCSFTVVVEAMITTLKQWKNVYMLVDRTTVCDKVLFV